MMHKIIFLDAVDSTNSYLLEHDEPEGTVCASLNQTAGRGRSSRQWIVQPGDSLAFSMHLKEIPANKLMGAQIVAGYAVVESILPWLGARLKWPNDLVYQGKKLAGLLIETRFIGSTIKKAVFGVGIN
ncbi:MAG: biotin--[acetyl-CoA-carboxylase] ligase, partial [Deferribacteraceae bacterium]|nr:biotin--[acetyl-CoA-carboxylase] ligase [Deferribacteraceae bacterium]